MLTILGLLQRKCDPARPHNLREATLLVQNFHWYAFANYLSLTQMFTGIIAQPMPYIHPIYEPPFPLLCHYHDQ
jgi:hypothetical protein